jgi:N utilization substance protein B
VINTLLSKQIKSIKSLDDTLELPVVFKDLDDKEFVRKMITELASRKS